MSSKKKPNSFNTNFGAGVLPKVVRHEETEVQKLQAQDQEEVVAEQPQQQPAPQEPIEDIKPEQEFNAQVVQPEVKTKETEPIKPVQAVKSDKLTSAMSSATEEQKIEFVSQKPGMLEYIEVQTPAVVQAALNRSVSNFRFVKEQTPEMCLSVVRLDPSQMKWVKDQTQELCTAALQWWPSSIIYIKNPTKQMRRYAIEHFDKAILYIESPTDDEIKLAAVYHPNVTLTHEGFQDRKDSLIEHAIAYYKDLGVTLDDVMSYRVKIPFEAVLEA